MTAVERLASETTSATLQRYTVDIPKAMIVRLDALAREARRLMNRDVTRAALFRAALLPWLARVETVDQGSLTDTLQEIYRAAPLIGTRLYRSRPTWSKELTQRLDQLKARLGVTLSNSAVDVRSALVLAALKSWLPTAEDQPLKALDAIRAGLVKRGRRPKR